MQKSRFLKPDESADFWQQDKSDIETVSSTSFVYNAHLSLALEEQRVKLPIYKYRRHIIHILETFQCLILVGETGSGKSSQVPQYLYEAGWCNDGKQICVSEPRRVAVTTLATRVAEEKGCPLGGLVGYSIRFDNCCDNETRIKFMTEGMLMREIMKDPLLGNYSVIVLDEVHERTLNTDILLGLLKKIMKKQRKLRLVIASATVDAKFLAMFFNFNTTSDKTKDTSTILSVEGRLYPVKTFYLTEPISDYTKAVVDTVLKIHKFESNGDILCFLTGQEEVDSVVSILSSYDFSNSENNLLVLPMYGSLPNSEQLKVFRYAPKGMRKVIVATNIAETSVTIPGIVYVIDCGFVKLRWFEPESQIDSLVVVPISKASAKQRAGRAGRHRPGKVYRLYTEQAYESLDDNTPPEMRRVELSGGVLKLKALGIDNIVRFNFPCPPPAKSLLSAVELLHALGALSHDAQLTLPLGLQMAEFPLSPLHAKSLLISSEFGCSDEMAGILCLLQVENLFLPMKSGAMAIKARIKKRNFEVEEGDLLVALNVYTAFLKTKEQSRKQWCYQNFINYKALLRVNQLKSQMLSLLTAFQIPIVSCKGNSETIRKCITAGFFPNAAYLHPTGTYRTVRGKKELTIHPTSVLYTLKQPQWVVYCETVQGERLMMRDLTVVEPDWLHQLAPHFYHITTSKDDF